MIILSCLLVSLGFYFARDTGGVLKPTVKTDYDEQVVQNYKNYCAGCHGHRLEKFADDNWMFARSEAEIVAVIRDGEEVSGMPSFSQTFTEKEIDALAGYIQHAAKTMAVGKEKKDFSLDHAVETGTAFWAETILSDMDSPWGLEFLPDGDLLITERYGSLLRFNPDIGLVEIHGLPSIRAGGQGGLMDLQLHPDYKSNGWIYISYSYYDEEDASKGNTAIMRAKLDGNQLTEQEIICKATPTVETQHHYGSRIEFDRDGYLYFSVGDRGRRDNFPQSIENSNGKIHRLYDDGRIPEDNPFINTPGADKSIFTYGHRNIQGLAMNPQTGEIWAHEHGPKGGDEINILHSGKNYGWPVISYGINYDGTIFTKITEIAGMEQPIEYYIPSIAPCGMAFITSTRYKGWENCLLIGSLSFEYLEFCKIENNAVVGHEKLLQGIGRVRNVRVGPDGYIYVAVEKPGKLLRLIPVDNE